MKNIAALGLAGLLVTITTVASADDTKVVVSDASLKAGFAPAHASPSTKMKSPGTVAGGIVLTAIGLGVVGGGVGMIGWWVSNNADSVVDSHTSGSFYSGVGTLMALGVVGTVAGIVLVSQGARRVEVRPGLGSISFSGTF
jgi:hypothetical protein